MKPVMICGGIGKKMWPLSRVEKPKHFLNLLNGKSLYRTNYDILLNKFSPDEIFVQTTQDQADLAHEQAPDIPLKNFFIEPELRDTGPALGLMAAKLNALNPDEPFILIQVDVLRDPGPDFLKMIDLCDRLVRDKGRLVTGGRRPDFLMDGVDYLQTEPIAANENGISYYNISKYVDRTTPEKELQRLFDQKLIFIHANHYSWTPRQLLNAYKKITPSWYAHLEKISKAVGSKSEKAIIRLEYSKMEKGRTETLTEKIFSESILIDVPFKWFDFGTWESLSKYKKQAGSYQPGDNYLEIESNNCYVDKTDKKLVALVGVEDLVVVDTKDALLVCKSDLSDRVGDIVGILKEKGKEEYL